jgi:hypothetical protein
VQAQIDEINEQLKALDEHSAVVALSDAVSAPVVPQQEEKPYSVPPTTAETASAASAFPFLLATSSHAAASDGVRESGGPGKAATLGLPAASATDGGSAFSFLMAAGTSETNGASEASRVPLQISSARGEPEPVAPDGRDELRADGADDAARSSLLADSFSAPAQSAFGFLNVGPPATAGEHPGSVGGEKSAFGFIQ